MARSTHSLPLTAAADGHADVDAPPTVAAAGCAGAVAAFVRRKPLGAAGAAIVILMALTAVFAALVAPYDPLETDYGAMFAPPSREHWLGTDSFGRDQLSRIIFGSRTALLVGFCASVVGATLGLVLGTASAYFGARTDMIVQRVMDMFLSFPLIILALAVVAILGTGTWKVILAITVPMIPRAARVCRSTALTVRESPYVDAARACGFRHARIILRHMIPNVVPPYLIVLTAFVGQAILLEASLSYLGLGVQEPTPAWGLMLQGGAEEYAESAPWIPVFPGLAITAAVFAFNLFGDSLRDVLDPKLRTQ
jgi:peptide/nickel transport system permease protein